MKKILISILILLTMALFEVNVANAIQLPNLDFSQRSGITELLIQRKVERKVRRRPDKRRAPVDTSVPLPSSILIFISLTSSGGIYYLWRKRRNRNNSMSNNK